MPNRTLSRLILAAATLSALCGFSATRAAAQDSGYMDRLLMAASGQEPPPAPEPAAAEIEDPAPMQTAGLPLLPGPSGDDMAEPMGELELASGEMPDRKSYEDMAPEAGDTPQETGTITAEPAESQTPALTTEPAYRLNVGDLLRITVYGVEDLSNAYRIDSTGSVTVPLVGEIPARGRLKEEIQAEIAKRLIDGGYYNSPSVTVEIMELAPFYILGEVNKPGRYPYEPGLDVIKAIATAGGHTPRAAKDKIVIIRDVNGQKTEIDAREDTEVLPGDSIKVKQRFF